MWINKRKRRIEKFWNQTSRFTLCLLQFKTKLDEHPVSKKNKRSERLIRQVHWTLQRASNINKYDGKLQLKECFSANNCSNFQCPSFSSKNGTCRKNKQIHAISAWASKVDGEHLQNYQRTNHFLELLATFKGHVLQKGPWNFVHGKVAKGGWETQRSGDCLTTKKINGREGWVMSGL